MPVLTLPGLGYATSEATILRWLKNEGEDVQKEEPLLEVASEKTIHVVASPADGKLLAVYAPPGAIVPEGEPLGWVGAANEKAPPLTCRLTGWEEEVAPAPSDLAERMALVSQPPLPRTPAGAPPTMERQFRSVLKGQLRRITAQRMTRSWQESPKVDLFADVDFSRVEAHRKALKALGREAPSFNIYIAHAVVRAFQDLPGFNMHWIEGRIIPLKKINVGLAVALGDNLVTVSLKDLAGVNLMEIQRQFKGLIRKALQLSLSREELYGSSLTITNLGEFDISAFTAILNPPEVFILAVGKVEQRVVVREGAMAIAPMCTLVLSFDHRAVDGAPASRLMQRIKHHLELLEGVESPEA